MNNQNARITGTQLGVKHTDHGILSFWITLDFGGGGQGFGGWCLDTNNPGRLHDGPYRRPTILATSLLLGIYEVFGCDWEELKGLSCRAYGSQSKVVALGHYLNDKWLWLKKISENEFEFVVTRLSEVPSE